MSLRTPTAVIGCAIARDWHEGTQSLEEALHTLAQAALKDAGLNINDIDGIVVASNDQYDGRAISIMAASGSVGGVNRDILSTPSASDHAMILGSLRVGSGLFGTQLVVSWSPLEVSSLPEAQRLAADPYYHRALPLDELSSHAMQAASLEASVPEVRRLARRIGEKNRANGIMALADLAYRPTDDQTKRWPLDDRVTTPPSSGGAALILASADVVREREISKAAWVQGMGWATEASFLGDRDLTKAPALAAACERAYNDAALSDPFTDLDLAEVADTTAYQELLAYEGLGFSDSSDWAERIEACDFDRSGRLPVNLSGGALSHNPVYCTGLISITEVVKQLLGRADSHQKDGVRRGVAHAASGPAMQYQTVLVLGSDAPESVV